MATAIASKEGSSAASSQVALRPIEQDDLPIYQSLFTNPVAMRLYRGGVRDITDRFQGWLDRWKIHPFSAMAVIDTVTRKVIGHVILGHGDYEGNLHKGWSEMAIVIDPAYWNAEHAEPELGIGTENRRGIGTETIRALVAYARALKKEGQGVPSDVNESQREELEKLSASEEVKAHRDKDSAIDWVYLPFTELRATCARVNTAAYKALERVFIRENGGNVGSCDEERDLFTLSV